MILLNEKAKAPIIQTKYKSININENLFIRIARDDRDAFAELYHLTERTLYAFVLSILKNHDNTLDVVQDTYLKIRASAHLYKPQGKPMAWLFTIARNLSISKIRSQKQQDNIQIADIENDLSFSYITDSTDRLILQSALNILSQQEREIILLHAVSGFAHREIAESLSLPLSTVLSKYHRGLKKLKNHIEKGPTQ